MILKKTAFYNFIILKFAVEVKPIAAKNAETARKTARKVKPFEKYKKSGEKRFDFQAKYCKIYR